MTQFVVALRAEAHPLIEMYRLLPEDTPSTFPTFKQGDKRLVICGVGKHRAAAATSHLFETSEKKLLEVWLNIGIAGHRDRPTGSILRAHTVQNVSKSTIFHPGLIGSERFETACITTVDQPETTFRSTDIYDMEAVGFFETAVRFSTAELVQCLKIISDNRASGIRGLTNKQITKLLEKKLLLISNFVTDLEELAQELEPVRNANRETLPFVKRWHFSTTERRYLSQLLTRCAAYNYIPSPNDFYDTSQTNIVLQKIERELSRQALELKNFK